MAKKPSAPQPSLFKKPVPAMPEGYYSSGPNPNLRRFVAEHATRYDPETDKYKVAPFHEQIAIDQRKSASMDLHIYWSKKPHEAIRQYIRHYTQPGDLVLDTFCGSGGTALAALVEGRSVIAIDLSPAATFITKNYCTPVDVGELQHAIEELQAKVKPEMDWLYETRCDRCDGQAMTAYTVYSQVFQCPSCNRKVALFDCPEVEIADERNTDKPKRISVCPHCYPHRSAEEVEISTRSERFGAIPVLACYECLEGCQPRRGERLHNDQDDKKRHYFEQYDLGKIREIEGKTIPHWYPPHRMMNVESDTASWGDKWRAGTSNFRTVAELFTKRNLWALAAIRNQCVQSGQRDFLLFVLNSSILTVSRMCRHDWPSVMAGTYYVPQVHRELNAWNNFSGRIPRKTEGIREIVASFSQSTLSALVSTQSATSLDAIEGNSIDYIFTDPPYADKVQYGELNFVWEAWMGLDTHWHGREIIVNATRGQTESDWASNMRLALNECYRVLKPSRWISLCYHDTSEGTWQLVQDIMAEVGFLTERTDSVLFIDTAQKSYNQLVADKATKRDLVINFRKPGPDDLPIQLALLGTEDSATFSEKARAILSNALEAHPGSSADRLYDELVSRMVRRGEFERHNFEELLAQVAEPVRDEKGARWYLKETAGQVDEAESDKETSSAARLEDFMTTYLAENPEKPGVHYSDLFEHYLPVRDKPRRRLADWLPEFFFKTPEGVWRPPATSEERAEKVALRSSGALRAIKRFANALLEGVPPAERDRPANTATAADWIRQCRRAGLYDLGRVLYERGGFAFSDLSTEAQVEVDEDYQVCARRSG